MLISIRDCKHSPIDRQWIKKTYAEYMEDLSFLNTGLFPLMADDVPRQDEIFAGWFANDNSHPLVILKGEERVGFALVTRPRFPPAGEKRADYLMSEFFIRKPYRRTGIGRDAATLIFNRFSGDWEVLEYLRNPGAVAFWRRVLGLYAPGRFDERSRNGEVRQRFKSGSTAA